MPYDVIYEAELRAFAAAHPMSFLRVTRSEADFTADLTPSRDAVFARAVSNLKRLIDEGVFVADTEPAIYVYRLAQAGHTQTGVIACCSIDEYDAGLIKKHENVRPDKVEDRAEHMLAVRAQTGLIFLAYRRMDAIDRLVAEITAGDELYDFVCDLKVRHTIWRATGRADLIEAFGKVPALYIADGHHRAESSKIVRDSLRAADPDADGSEEYNFMVAGMFPAEELRILPYNRVIYDLNGLTPADLIERLGQSFIVTETTSTEPEKHGEICMYIDGRWFKLVFNVQYYRQPDPVERLDVSILQQFVLEPLLGLGDARTDQRIGFVGGRLGTQELERLVDAGKAQVAFSMFPTTMDDLLAVSDMGETMPPKSTWFEPKLRDGLIVHPI